MEGGSGDPHPATGGHWGFGSKAPSAGQFYDKNNAFLCTFRPK